MSGLTSGDADTHAPRNGDKNIDIIHGYGQTSTPRLPCEPWRERLDPASENLPCCYFFFVFFGVFFLGGFFLPGPLCGMSLLLSSG